MRAGHPRGMLKAPIEFLRSARLTHIESLCAHLNRNCENLLMKALTMVRFIDNESSRRELDTPKIGMTVS
jgi:hypothetical protein